jgi:hypothetical protein
MPLTNGITIHQGKYANHGAPAHSHVKHWQLNDGHDLIDSDCHIGAFEAKFCKGR